jgi:redox-sensing transcriptional repressor
VTINIPDIVVARLPNYLRALTRMAEEGDEPTISPRELGRRLEISPIQVQKDLSYVGELDSQGEDYNLNYLINRLRQILIPEIVIGRLPIYLRALTRMSEETDKATTSSHELGEQLGISSAQIRKDLSHFGEFGKQGTGYHINYLIDQLRKILNLEREWPVVLVGAGHIGHALANYSGFRPRGFSINWIFDNDLDVIGELINGLPVQSMGKLKGLIKRENVRVAIMAVPVSAAQDTADLLIEAGIKAILSYAPINLNVPEEIQVTYSDPVIQLQRMTFYLENEED